MRTVTLDDRLRAEQPGGRGGDGRRGLASLVLVPVTADSRRLGVLVLGLGGAGQGDLISLDEPEAVAGHRAGRRRTALDPGAAGRPGAGAGAAVRGDRPAGGAVGVPARGGPAARRGGRRRRDRGAAGRPGGRAAGRPLRHRPDHRAGHRPGRRCGTATRRGSTLADELRRAAAAAARVAAPERAGAAASGGTRVGAGRSTTSCCGQITVDAAAPGDRPGAGAGRASIAVPFVAEGRPLGVITLAADARARPVHRGRRRGGRAARRCRWRSSLAKAQRYELDVRTSHTLQANLLPPAPPRGAGLRMAVRYLAATHGRGGRRRLLRRRPAARTSRSRWRSGTSSATTSPPRRRWAS